MDNHPDEGRLRALLDDELGDAEARELRVHVGSCTVCETAVRRSEETQVLATALLDALDVEAPTARVRMRLTEHRAQTARRRQASRFGFGRRELARAALMVLGFSGAVAAAVHPASPVRRLLMPEPTPPVLTPTPEPTPALATAPAREVGVRLVVPSAGVRVALTGAAAGSRIEVSWVDGGSASVYAPEGTSFTTAEALGRIEAQMVGSGTVRVELPRETGNAALVVDGTSYLVKTGERIDFPGPAALVEGPRVTFEVR
jgi:anti-sigma factor RsiW